MVLPDHILTRLAAHEADTRRGAARRRCRRPGRFRPTVRQLPRFGERLTARDAPLPCS